MLEPSVNDTPPEQVAYEEARAIEEAKELYDTVKSAETNLWCIQLENPHRKIHMTFFYADKNVPDVEHAAALYSEATATPADKAMDYIRKNDLRFSVIKPTVKVFDDIKNNYIPF